MQRLSLVLVVFLMSPLTELMRLEASEMIEDRAEPELSRPDEPFTEAFSLAAAVHLLDSVAVNWQKKHECLSCHASYPFLMARPLVAPGSDAEQEVRKAAEYLALHPRKSSFVPAEAVMVASTLAQHDARTSGKLHPATRFALDRIWDLQRDDGGWDWVHAQKPPSEVDDDYGVTMAAFGVGCAPENYAETPAARNGLEKIRRYLRNHPPANLHNRSMRLLASLHVDGLIDEAGRRKVVEDLFDSQKLDGGWGLATLGRNWNRSDGTPQDYEASDGYGTGFAIYVLRSAGVSAEDARIRKGIDWLKTHQRASGRWFTRSMEKDGKHYVTYPGTAYAVLALISCGHTLKE